MMIVLWFGPDHTLRVPLFGPDHSLHYTLRVLSFGPDHPPHDGSPVIWLRSHTDNYDVMERSYFMRSTKHALQVLHCIPIYIAGLV